MKSILHILEDRVISRVRYSGILFVFVVLLIGCSPTAATPQSGATAAPAASKTPIPLPPQPTSATLAPRTPSPFQSPTPATRLGPAGTVPAPVVAAPASPAATTAAVAPTQPASTSGGPAPTAAGVAAGRRSEVKFTFLTPLKPAEEAEPAELGAIRTELKKVNGFLDISGDENVVTVGYDGGLITVEQLMQKFADLKYPVKRQ